MANTTNRNYKTGKKLTLEESRTADLNSNAEVASRNGDSVVSYYMDKFYHEARGHLINKYQVGLWGDLVGEALRIMDRNSYADKYTLTNTKTFKDTGDAHIKTSFNNWASLFYSSDTKILNMYWAAQEVNIGMSTNTPKNFSIDTTKPMMYPLVIADAGPKELRLKVLDDPYMMWYQFFNSLYNAQFSPLVLKPKDTWQRLFIGVDLYNDATTTTRSSNWGEATSKSPFITDISPIQLFEFNSCVMTGAPVANPSTTANTPFTFTVSFKYPNAFQGTFKTQLRYLRDNTVDATDQNAVIMKHGGYSAKSFYEENLEQIHNRGYLFEAFDPDEYYKEYGKRYFKSESD